MYCKLGINIYHIIPINLCVIVKRDRKHLGWHCYYNLPMKFWEGNVFTGVCLSVHRGRPHVTITCDALNLTVQGPCWSGPPPLPPC